MDHDMAGQRSSSGGSMAGCDLNESIYSPQRKEISPVAVNGPIVFSWGRGEDGQLGLGDKSDQHTPTFLDALRGIHVQQLACGSGHTCILTQDGEVYTWGRGDDGRLGHGDSGWKFVPRLVNSLVGQIVTQITCGSYHTAAVTNNGELYTWGGGMYGKLGHGSESGCSTPRKVEGLSSTHIKAVACGSRHTVAVSSTGALYSWGDKENGVAGHENTEGHQFTPKIVEKLKNKVVVQLSACGFHTGCITQDKQVYIWGEGKFGRLGLGSERNCHTPRMIDDMIGTDPKQISCGGFHTAIVCEDGKLYTFGGGEHGQLGHGDKFNRVVPTLVEALATEKISQITCGWSHTVVLTSRGICSFGNGEHGKLGHGDTKKLSTPKLIEKLKGHRVLSIASYNEHTAALVEPLNSMMGTSTIPVTQSYVQSMRDMIDNDEYSDVLFRLDDGVVHAHKMILSNRCEFFAAMFRSGMRETIEGEIMLPNVSKKVFLALMEYVYTDSVVMEVDVAVDLYKLADIYGLERLTHICVSVVKRNLNTLNATTILQHATDEACFNIKDIAMDFVITNFERISKTDGIRLVSHELLLEILAKRP